MPKKIKNLRNVGFGLQPLPKDNRDFSLAGIFSQINPKEIPNTNWLVAEPLKIYDQKDTDFCTGNGIAGVTSLQEGMAASPEYQIKAIKEVRGEYKEWGADTRSACKSAVKFGSIPYDQSPFKMGEHSRDEIANWNNWPESYDDIAKQYRKRSYFRVDTGRFDVFDNIRTALWANKDLKCGVFTGAIWRPSWQNASGGIIPVRKETGGFGHAFYLIGQKIINNESQLIAVNSYGENVGDKGL